MNLETQTDDRRLEMPKIEIHGHAPGSSNAHVVDLEKRIWLALKGKVAMDDVVVEVVWSTVHDANGLPVPYLAVYGTSMDEINAVIIALRASDIGLGIEKHLIAGWVEPLSLMTNS